MKFWYLSGFKKKLTILMLMLYTLHWQTCCDHLDIVNHHLNFCQLFEVEHHQVHCTWYVYHCFLHQFFILKLRGLVVLDSVQVWRPHLPLSNSSFNPGSQNLGNTAPPHDEDASGRAFGDIEVWWWWRWWWWWWWGRWWCSTLLYYISQVIWVSKYRWST